jgi:hypothetical protein
MEHVTISIDDNTGNVTFLVSELSRVFLDDTSTVRRASHVEPVNVLLRGAFYLLRFAFGEYGKVSAFTRVWCCKWRVNLSPVNGPVLPVFYSNRGYAITAEIEWLENNFL